MKGTGRAQNIETIDHTNGKGMTVAFARMNIRNKNVLISSKVEMVKNVGIICNNKVLRKQETADIRKQELFSAKELFPS